MESSAELRKLAGIGGQKNLCKNKTVMSQKKTKTSKALSIVSADQEYAAQHSFYKNWPRREKRRDAVKSRDT